MEHVREALMVGVLWFFWCALHSLLVANWMKNWLCTLLGRHAGLYRLGFVMVSVITLIPVVLYQHNAAQAIFFVWHDWWRILQAGLVLYGVVFIYFGGRGFDLGYFLGLAQWRNYRRGKLEIAQEFASGGALRWVRHPWYSAGIALVWGLGPLSEVTLVAKMVITAYFILGTFLEERKLVEEFGQAYLRYRAQVPRLLPRFGRSLQVKESG